MAMNFAFALVTLVPAAGGSTATASWQHPSQLAAGAGAEVVELDAAPLIVIPERTSAPGGAAGVVSVTAATVTGVTLLSTHVGETGTFRVFAWVRPLPPWWES